MPSHPPKPCHVMLNIAEPYSVIFLIRTYLSGMWFGVSPRTDTKGHEYKRDPLLTWNGWEDLCDHSMSTIVITLIMNKMFMRALIM